jgi:uncharacterized protein YbjT (DUF2867 family)
MLGERLAASGWAVRGTSRRREGLAPIEAAGLEAALADPERPGSVLELVGDVAVLHLLLGSARGEPRQLEAIHGPRLESLLERLVDTPVRGVAYEARGSVEAGLLEAGAELVRAAGRRWRIPFEILAADPADAGGWCEAALAGAEGLLSPRRGA